MRRISAAENRRTARIVSAIRVDHIRAQVGLGGTAAAIGGMLLTLATGWLVENVSFGSVFMVTVGMTLGAVAVTLWPLPNRGRSEFA